MRHQTADQRVANAERSATAFASRNGPLSSKWAYETGVLRAELGEVCFLLERFNGALEKPAKGCYFENLWVGSCEFLVECEYTPGSPAVLNPDSPMCGPEEVSQVALIRALVNGHWIDPEDIFDQTILDRLTQQAFCAAEDRERARIEDACEHEREAA